MKRVGVLVFVMLLTLMNATAQEKEIGFSEKDSYVSGTNM